VTRPQALVVTALLLLATSVSALLAVFAARTTLVAAEGDDLRTADSIVVSATLRELTAAAEAGRFADGTRVFVDVEPGVRAVALLAGGWPDVPLHAGRPLSGSEGEALVGSGRVDSPADDPSGVRVGGRHYSVVGVLGLRATSLLSDDVVVADRTRFTAEVERLRIDGPDVGRRYVAAFPDRTIERVASSTNRRTNVDVVSPLLLVFGAATAASVALVAGVSGARWERRRSEVLLLTGIARSRRTAHAVVVIAALTMVAATVSIGIGGVVGVSLGVSYAPVAEAVASTSVLALACGSVRVLLVRGA
jgi:hypothetical protein